MKQAVQVIILGQQYMVRSDAPPEEVRKVATFVNQQIAEVTTASKVVDSLNAAILTLLNVSGDYLRLRDEEAAQCGAAMQRLEKVVARLEDDYPGNLPR